MSQEKLLDLPLLPDQPPTLPGLEPSSTLAFRTPLQPYPMAADTKAGAILTAVGLMLTVAARYAPQLSRVEHGSALAHACGLALGATFVGSSLAATVQAFRTISPRFPGAPPSLAFFGDIASLTLDDYIARVEGLSHEESLRQMMLYNHTLSRICVEKFRQLDIGARFLRVAAVCWTAMMLLLLVRGVAR